MLKAFDEGRLFGATTGTARPWVLVLHGWRRTHADFAAVLGPAAGSTADDGTADDGTADDGTALDGIALDLPGFGATPAPPEPWGSAQYAEAVACVLSEMTSPVVVVGHSFGGGVALHLAARHPEVVGALVLTGVPRLVPNPRRRRRPPAAYRTGRFLHRRGLLDDARMEALGQRYGSADYRASAGVMRQVLVRTLAETYEDQLRTLTCPVELVWGDDDTETPLGMAQAASDLVVHSALTVCPGAGHLTPLSVPGALRQAIERCQPSGVTRTLGTDRA